MILRATRRHSRAGGNPGNGFSENSSYLDSRLRGNDAGR